MINDLDIYKVYVLALEDGKFYVGITKELTRRFLEHKTGIGAAFTKRHKPICIAYKQNTHTKYIRDAELIEQQVTVDLMKKYGIENVRGGDFCQINTQVVIANMKKSVYRTIIQANQLKKDSNVYSGIDKIIEGLDAGTMKVKRNGTVKRIKQRQPDQDSKEGVERILPKARSNSKKKKKKNKNADFWWENYKPSNHSVK